MKNSGKENGLWKKICSELAILIKCNTTNQGYIGRVVGVFHSPILSFNSYTDLNNICLKLQVSYAPFSYQFDIDKY